MERDETGKVDTQDVGRNDDECSSVVNSIISIHRSQKKVYEI
jgi:hypothetical protein